MAIPFGAASMGQMTAAHDFQRIKHNFKTSFRPLTEHSHLCGFKNAHQWLVLKRPMTVIYV